MGGVAGDDRVGQVHRVQQVLDLGDLIGVLGDGVLGDDHLLLVQHRGEQLDLLPVADAAQPFPVDRDRAQQVLQLPRVRQAAQPAPGQLIQCRRVDLLEQGADPLLARGDDPPAQRMRPAAEPGQHFLRQIHAWSPISRKYISANAPTSETGIGDDRDDRGAQAAQEEEYHDTHRRHRLADGVEHVGDGALNEHRRVVGDDELDPLLAQVLVDLVDFAAHAGRQLERIRHRLLDHADVERRLAVVARDGAVVERVDLAEPTSSMRTG